MVTAITKHNEYALEHKTFANSNYRDSILSNNRIYTVTNYLPIKRVLNAKKNQPTNTLRKSIRRMLFHIHLRGWCFS